MAIVITSEPEVVKAVSILEMVQYFKLLQAIAIAVAAIVVLPVKVSQLAITTMLIGAASWRPGRRARRSGPSRT